MRLRAGRIKALSPDLFLAAETDIGAVLKHLDDVNPSLLIVDSVQTMAIADVDGSAGGVTQVRQVAAALIAVAKERGIATVLVGHVTKDGSIAGPRVLEHLVDVVLQFEGERHSRLRLVRAIKNRYGACDEVGCFDLTEEGIVGLADPSGLFLSRRGAPVSGTCVTVALEGRRPLVAEVQALVASSNLSIPRRTTSGLDTARVSMVLAVTERRAKILLAGLGRLHRDGRRRETDRASRRPGCRTRRSERGERHARCCRASSPSVRWAWQAKCVASKESAAGSPKPPGLGSRSHWCHPTQDRFHPASIRLRFPTSHKRSTTRSLTNG